MRSRFAFCLTCLFALALTALPAHAQRVVRGDLALSPDGRIAATSTGTGTLLLWNVDTWTLRREHTDDGSRVFGFDFTDDSRYVSFGTQTGRLVVLDATTGAVVFDVDDRSSGSVSATRFGPDDRVFAAGQGRTVTSYNWRTGEALQTYDVGRVSEVEDFDVLGERGQLFIARFDGQARLMDLETGAVVHTWRNKRRARDGNRNVKDVAVLPGTSTGVFGGVGGDVIVVDLDTGARLDSVTVHPDFISDLKASPDGRLLAVTDLDGTTTLLDARELSTVQKMTQDGSFESRRLLFAVAFRPGTNQVVTGGIRLPLIVWNVETGERVREISSLP